MRNGQYGFTWGVRTSPMNLLRRVWLRREMRTRMNVLDAALVVCAVVLMLLVVRKAVSSPEQAKPVKQLSTPEWEYIAGTGSRMGSAAAPVQVVEFADFQCPACRTLALELRRLRTMYPNRFAVLYRHLPITGGADSRLAATASECAAVQGRFDAYHDLLYNKQDSIGLIPWDDFAMRAKVPRIAEFNACMGQRVVSRRITDDSLAGERLGVNATPAFVVNGALYIGAPSADALRGIVSQSAQRGRE